MFSKWQLTPRHTHARSASVRSVLLMDPHFSCIFMSVCESESFLMHWYTQGWMWPLSTKRGKREKPCRPLAHPLQFSLCVPHYSYCACNLMCCVFVCPIPPAHPQLQHHVILHFCMPPEVKWSLTLHIFYLNCSNGRMYLCCTLHTVSVT